LFYYRFTYIILNIKKKILEVKNENKQ